MDTEDLREREYLKRLEANALRRQVYTLPASAAAASRYEDLGRVESQLSALSRERAEAETASRDTHELRGAQSTGLEVAITVHLAEIPSAVYHLFDPAEQPLVSCTVRNAGDDIRRVRITSRIAGYSADAVDTIELEAEEERTVDQLPTLFPDRVRHVTELTGATLSVLAEDLDGTVETHQTKPVRLLARTTAPLMVHNPSTGLWTDLSRYLGAFVTPNSSDVMTFLRSVVEHHPEGELVGYQKGRDAVEPQVRAIFAALRDSGIAYVNSVVALNPDEGASAQRVRLPRESLADRQANCVDGTVLFASLLEAVSLSPAIVVVPGHALVAWETWQLSNEWRYLETTLISTDTFEEACTAAEELIAGYHSSAQDDDDPYRLRSWPVRRLRAAHRIYPME